MYEGIYFVMISIGLFVMLGSQKMSVRNKKNSSINGLLKQVYVKERVDKEEEEYSRKKIALVGMIVLVCGVLGMIYVFSFQSSAKNVEEIDRPTYGSGSVRYNLVAINENKDLEEEVNVEIEEKKHSKEEAEEICKTAFEKCKKLMLNKNESSDNITGDLFFPANIDDVNFLYVTESDEYISQSGEISFGKIPFVDGKYFTDIMVIYSFGDFVFENNVALTLVSTEKTSTIQQQLQEYIDKYDASEKRITLPKKIEGDKVSFIDSPEEEYVWLFIPTGIFLSIVIVFAKDRELRKKAKERHEQLGMDYSEIVSLISVLHESGNSIKKSWERTVDLYDRRGIYRYAYEEMKLAKYKMENGMPETQAYREFGNRCGIHEYIKLANILEQNIYKGSNEMKLQLQMEVREANISRLSMAKKKAEECSTNLLIPMVMMLVVTMIILIVPAFMSMNIG